jgi:hypothetical protein
MTVRAGSDHSGNLYAKDRRLESLHRLVVVSHVTENHPDLAKQMEKVHNEDPKKWSR